MHYLSIRLFISVGTGVNEQVAVPIGYDVNFGAMSKTVNSVIELPTVHEEFSAVTTLIIRRIALGLFLLAGATLVIDQFIDMPNELSMWAGAYYFVPLISLFLLWRVGVKSAAWCMVMALWCAVTISVMRYTGLNGVLFAGYIVVIFLAAIVLPEKRWYLFLGLSIVAGIGIAFAEWQGVLVPQGMGDGSSWWVWGAQLAVLTGTSLLIMGSRRQVNNALRSVQQTNVQLESNRRLLEQRQAENAATNARLQLESEERRQSIDLLRKTEQALRVSEGRYRVVFNNDPSAIVITDLTTQKIIDVNDSAVRLLGMGREELIDRTMTDMTPKELPGWVSPDADLLALDVATNGDEAAVYEWAYQKAGDEMFPAEVRLVRLPATDGRELLQHSIVDITERHYALRALRESEARYRTLVENAPEAIVVVDLDTHAIVEVNDKAARLFGYSRIRLLSMDADDLLAIDSAETPHSNLADLANATEDGQQFVFECTQTREDESQFPAEMHLVRLPSGNRNLVRVSIFDVTKRRDIEMERELEKAQMERFISAIPGSVAITTADEEGLVLWANEEMAAKVGLPVSEIVGQPIGRFYANNESRLDLLERVRALGGIRDYEFEAKSGDGTTYWARASVTLMEYQGRLCTLGIVEDVTDVKQQQQTLRQVQKLESLGVLAGGIAHDFNNLLVAIMGQSSLAMAKLDEFHRARPHIEKAVSATKRASALTRQMLAYSGKGQFEVSPLDINELIDENYHLFEVSVPKQIQFDVQMSPTLPQVRGDAAQMQQLVMNLLINASEAMNGSHGEIRVRTGVKRVSAENDILYTKFTGTRLSPGRYVAISVTDTGSGMDDETLAHIFDPFYTTKSTGSGLGLAAVLGIIRGHNGGLLVDTAPGEGTTFEVVFPALNTHSQPDTEPIEPANIQLDKPSILVIDDEDAVREAVADILESDGLHVVTAANGMDGLERYRDTPEQFDLVLLDMSMPGMDGTETLAELRRFDPDVRVVMSSGYSPSEVYKNGTKAAAAGFIEKPYDAERFTQEIRKYMDTNGYAG